MKKHANHVAKNVTTHQMTVAGESDRETNEATRRFSFYPATTGLSTDCDKFIIFTDIKLSVQPYIWRIW